ncbi:phage portal protein [Cellulosimicrobium sp. XJ-DQ-B-000]|uniref:phage portal protein n=1 Tax=Cellulosimicrobium sp. XJ-DQ-B-000 TaxID=3072182 RepID=UPI0028090884|nr:phage portal protein [Cellulosimicrobium sp. XJ-DQ-B-000]MDQ8040658.1 phage portal protein [Cellulosimicrobium sp. XJ-DQ-B-000]
MPINYQAKESWPPAPFGQAQTAMAAWSDWWSGDPERLTARYAGATRPAVSRGGGLAGAARKFFHSGTTTPGAPPPPPRLHLPLPADLTRTSADLLFGTGFTPVIGEGESPMQDRLAELLGGDDTLVTLANAAEAQSALGGTYLRAVWDKGVAEKPWVSTVDADAAVPEFRWGRLAAVTFWQKVAESNGEVWRFLERYEPGRIFYALYKGTVGEIGMQMPLEEHNVSRPFAELVDDEGGMEIPTQRLAASYVPNVTPNPKWRNHRDLVHLGRSDFDQLAPWFDAIDEVYSSLMRDVRLGKGRLFVEASAMQSNGPGKGATFNADEEIYTAYPGAGGMGSGKDGGAPITPWQYDIRVQEHTDTLRDLIGAVIRKAGYSAASFGDDQIAGMMTATQVVARQDLSKLTRAKKLKHWQAALAHMGAVLLEIDGALYPGKGGGTPDGEITINFPTDPNPDIASLATTALALKNADAASVETRVRTVHPNWTSDQVNEEVDRIKDEGAMPDPFTLRPGIDASAPEAVVAEG